MLPACCQHGANTYQVAHMLPAGCNSVPPPCHHVAIALPFRANVFAIIWTPLCCHVAITLPSHWQHLGCHDADTLPSYRHRVSITMCEVFVWPCCCHVVAMLSPCCCHVVSTRLPCSCLVIATPPLSRHPCSVATPWPCRCHVITRYGQLL